MQRDRVTNTKRFDKLFQRFVGNLSKYSSIVVVTKIRRVYSSHIERAAEINAAIKVSSSLWSTRKKFFASLSEMASLAAGVTISNAIYRVSFLVILTAFFARAFGASAIATQKPAFKKSVTISVEVSSTTASLR